MEVTQLRTMLEGRTTPDLRASLATIRRRMIENGETHWTHKHDACRSKIIDSILRERVQCSLDWLAS